ncbi:glycosyltransferase [Paenibacillus sp. NPDC058177]|uniref:glycosyltransferase n=1 Tax=Paenibacillus sp. NPDC058177 TaxID=3346369 RepID=UPI0036DCE43D
MKILIINDYLVYGGAEIQTLREKQILEKNGHEVYLITLDNNISENDQIYNSLKNFINIPTNYNYIRRNLHRIGILKIKSKLKADITRVLKEFSPDVVHLNNLNKEPFTVYKAVEKFKVVQTLRDYSAVCPLGTCIKPDGTICQGSEYNNCIKVCGDTLPKRMRFTLWKKIHQYRKKNIKKYIAPSLKLTEICQKNGYDIECINNSFDFEKYKNVEKKTDFNTKRFLYYGAVNINKGIMELLNAFEIFQENKNVELLIAGKLFEDVKPFLNEKIMQNNKIKYIGYLNYSEMMKTLENIHTIVVPSVWMENYPNTVLEGLSMEIFVIGSNRGGIPEMLANNRGYTFDIGNYNDIIDKLEKAYNLSEEDYSFITKNNKNYTVDNNSLDKYYSRLIKNFKRISGS